MFYGRIKILEIQAPTMSALSLMTNPIKPLYSILITILYAIFLVYSPTLSYAQTSELDLATPWAAPHAENFYSQGTLTLSPKVSYLTTSKNFDSAGNLLSTPTVSRFYYQTHFQYAVTSRLQFYTKLSFLNSKVETLGVSFGPSDTSLGLFYKLHSFPIDALFQQGVLGFQGDFSFPLYNNDAAKSARSPFLGEGTLSATGNFFANFSFQQNAQYSLKTFLGVHWQSQGYSSGIPYGIRFEKASSDWLSFIGLQGLASLKTDSTPLSASMTRSKLGSAGNWITGATNSSWLQAVGGLGYQLQSGTQVGLSGGASLNGYNSSQNFYASVWAKLNLDFLSKNTSTSKPTTSQDYSRAHSIENAHYDFTTKVLKLQTQLHFAKISSGKRNDISLGQYFDIFEGTTLLARAKVSYLRDDEAVLTVLEYFTDTEPSGSTSKLIAKRLEL